jgi:hypothetical protein
MNPSGILCPLATASAQKRSPRPPQLIITQDFLAFSRRKDDVVYDKPALEMMDFTNHSHSIDDGSDHSGGHHLSTQPSIVSSSRSSDLDTFIGIRDSPARPLSKDQSTSDESMSQSHGYLPKPSLLLNADDSSSSIGCGISSDAPQSYIDTNTVITQIVCGDDFILAVNGWFSFALLISKIHCFAKSFCCPNPLLLMYFFLDVFLVELTGMNLGVGVASADRGELMTCGNNHYGQLASGNCEPRTKLMLASSPIYQPHSPRVRKPSPFLVPMSAKIYF